MIELGGRVLSCEKSLGNTQLLYEITISRWVRAYLVEYGLKAKQQRWGGQATTICTYHNSDPIKL
jgi:hypothetical protein